MKTKIKIGITVVAILVVIGAVLFTSQNSSLFTGRIIPKGAQKNESKKAPQRRRSESQPRPSPQAAVFVDVSMSNHLPAADIFHSRNQSIILLGFTASAPRDREAQVNPFTFRYTETPLHTALVYGLQVFDTETNAEVPGVTISNEYSNNLRLGSLADPSDIRVAFPSDIVIPAGSTKVYEIRAHIERIERLNEAIGTQLGMQFGEYMRTLTYQPYAAGVMGAIDFAPQDIVRTAGETATLAKFTAAASSDGDGIIGNVTFKVELTGNPNIENLRLFKENADGTEEDMNQRVSIDDLGEQELMVVFIDPEEDLVAAGTSKTYELKGDVTLELDEVITVSHLYAGGSTAYPHSIVTLARAQVEVDPALPLQESLGSGDHENVSLMKFIVSAPDREAILNDVTLEFTTYEGLGAYIVSGLSLVRDGRAVELYYPNSPVKVYLNGEEVTYGNRSLPPDATIELRFVSNTHSWFERGTSRTYELFTDIGGFGPGDPIVTTLGGVSRTIEYQE